jgi:hypothetical protein
MADRQHVAPGGARTTRRDLRVVLLVFLAFVAAPLSANVAAAVVGGPAVDGIVAETGSGAPVVGAQLLVLWSGLIPRAIHSSSGGCYQVLNAVTDGAGRFSVPSWRKELRGVTVDDYAIYLYARGYGSPSGQLSGRNVGGLLSHAGGVASGGNRIVVPKFIGGVRERLELLAFLRNDVRCAEAGASRRNAIDFYRSMNAELAELAATPEGRAIADEEKVEVDRRKRLGLYRAMPLLIVDLTPTIAALQSAHDGELEEPVRNSR